MNWHVRVIGLAAATIALVVDLVTKHLVLVELPPHTAIPVTPFLNLRLGFNEGVSFGLLDEQFAGQPFALVALSTIIAVGLTIWLLNTTTRFQALALGLLIGGALANAVDRLLRGAVVDYLDFHLSGYHWPAFNMADVAVVGGAMGLVALSLIPSPNASI